MSCEMLFPLRLYGLRHLHVKHEILIPDLRLDAKIRRIPDEQSVFNGLFEKELREQFEKLFEILLPRDAEVIRFLVGFDGVEFSVTELAAYYGVCYVRIQQMRDRALGKLKEIILSEGVAEGFIDNADHFREE